MTGTWLETFQSCCDLFSPQESRDAYGRVTGAYSYVDASGHTHHVRYVADEAPLVPLMYGSTVVVHAWRVREVAVAADGQVDFAAVELDD